MGELAYLNGWTPDVLDRLSLADLMMWHGEALRIHNHINGGEA